MHTGREEKGGSIESFTKTYLEVNLDGSVVGVDEEQQ